MVLKIFLWTIIVIVLAHQVLLRVIRRFVHFPIPLFVNRLIDSRFRRWLQPPQLIVERSGIKKDMLILEIGCGFGTFTTSAARTVGPQGKVYALDGKARLRELEKKLRLSKNRDITNIRPVEAKAEALPFDENSFDLVFVVALFHGICDFQKALSEIKRVLKPGGVFSMSELLIDPDYRFRQMNIAHIEKSGLRFKKDSGNFWSYSIQFVND